MKNRRIEPATADDVGLILTMTRELAKWEGYDNQVIANEDLLLDSLFGEHAVAKVLIAYIDDRPVGYMIYCPKFATYTGRNEIYLQDLYLRKEARGSGIGLALMSKLSEIALAANASRIEWFVDKNNTLALSFYEKIGAQIIEDIKVVRIEGDNLRSLANCRDG